MNIHDGKRDFPPKFFFIVLNLQHRTRLLNKKHSKEQAQRDVQSSMFFSIVNMLKKPENGNC